MKRLTIHYNTKSRLYIMEFDNDGTKSLTAAPRWVKDNRTLEMWLSDRTSDGTFPNDVEIIFQ
jgi:hypothetical protein